MNAVLRQAMFRAGHAVGVPQLLCRLGDRIVWEEGHALPSWRGKSRETFLILIYHRVNPENSSFSIDTVTPDVFDKQMNYLARNFNVCSIEAILDFLKSGIPLPPRCLAITFDDGYQDNYEYAFPILMKYRLPATIFLTAGSINEQSLLWFDQVLYAFEHTRKYSWAMNESSEVYDLGSSQSRVHAGFKTLEILKRLPGLKRVEVIESLFKALEVQKPTTAGARMLSWDQIREMKKDGISFGSHTMTHPILTQISESEIQWELSESKRIIEGELGCSVRLFAYPNGRSEDYSLDIIRFIRDAGYESALTTVSGGNTRKESMYELNRLSCWWGRSLPAFSSFLSYWYLRYQPTELCRISDLQC